MRRNKRRPLSIIALAALLAGCSFVVSVDDTSYRVSVHPLVATALPTPTPTVTQTATPTQPAAPGATAWPTPTPELTPVPTVGPGGTEKLCLVKVRGTAINERTGPSTSAPKTTTSPIAAGSVVKVLEVAQAGGYLWGRNAFGWFVLREGLTWWVDGISGAVELCPDVPGWPAGLDPPGAIAQGDFGLWVGPGADISELLTFGVNVSAAGYRPAATVYGNDGAARALAGAGWTVALRPWVGDCPPTWEGSAESNAREWVDRAVEATEGVPRHWLVISNECGGWPSLEYAREWIAAALDQAARRGVRAAVPVVWNSGAPPLEWVPALAETYHEARIAAGWGVNVYPVARGVGLAERTAATAWTTYRYEMYRHHLRGVPIVVTEFARGDGSEPANFADIGAWWALARHQVALATAWYVAMPGGLGHWAAANLRGRLREMAGAVE